MNSAKAVVGLSRSGTLAIRGMPVVVFMAAAIALPSPKFGNEHEQAAEAVRGAEADAHPNRAGCDRVRQSDPGSRTVKGYVSVPDFAQACPSVFSARSKSCVLRRQLASSAVTNSGSCTQRAGFGCRPLRLFSIRLWGVLALTFDAKR